jgi:outer membrane lipoprotein-sorting protein
VQTRLTEASGDYMIIQFRNIKMNEKIADSMFDLKMPKNVQVIKM